MKLLGRKKLLIIVAIGLWVAVMLYANFYQIYRYLPARDGAEFVLSGGVLVDRVSQKPCQGLVRLKNGEQTAVFAYADGRPHGLGVVYDNGQVAEVVHWQNGRRDGKFMSFDNGRLRLSGTYRQNNKEGEWEQYENGRVALSRTYHDDVPEGVASRYYPNGRVYIRMNYQRGIPNGYYAMYAEDGTPIVEAFLKNGDFAAVKQYHSND